MFSADAIVPDVHYLSSVVVVVFAKKDRLTRLNHP